MGTYLQLNVKFKWSQGVKTIREQEGVGVKPMF